MQEDTEKAVPTVPEPKNRVLPVLPLRDIVVFPNMIVPLFVGREKTVRALEEAMANDKQILLVAQRESTEDDPGPDDVYPVGTVGKIVQLLKLPDNTVKVLVEGVIRASIEEFTVTDKFLQARITDLPDETPALDSTLEALLRAVHARFETYAKLSKKIGQEMVSSIAQIDFTDPGRIADAVSAQIGSKISDRQTLLETGDIRKRLDLIHSLIEAEIEVLKVERKIRTRVKTQMERSQREYYLNEQMKAIQRELGEGSDREEDDADNFRSRIMATKFSKEAKAKALGELRKLRSMSPMSAESTVVRSYIEWLLDVPWKKASRVNRDLKRAERILNEDHYGLEKVKERILEHLAVQQRTKRGHGQILCLVGPPGVGKTSLGESVARATGRKFVRVALGGIRDEAEIRGHRRTYVGSMPGRIIQGMKKAKVSNPLFLLDEIDKLGADWRGDPTSALLEVLDPEQNVTFNDHYLEVDYDLSGVFFLTTANTRSMPQPLLDRMEIIPLPGYTEREKIEIAKSHLIAKQMKRNGVRPHEWKLQDDALETIIRRYTREAGVRGLEREIAKLCRKAVRKIVGDEIETIEVAPEDLAEYLGPPRHRYGEIESEQMVGVATGLAYTEVGGDLLTIEAVTMPGKGRRQITGQLGDVMQESVKAAVSYLRSRAPLMSIEPEAFDTRDIHLHVPEGATPKDGPSAGLAIVTSILSALTGIPASARVAMTGEVTLRGRILPIGGLKEKLLAALRGSIRTVLIPKDNEKDLAEVPDEVKEGLEIVPVNEVDEILSYVLPELTTREWSDDMRELTIPAGPPVKPVSDDVTRH
ncbi:MAG: endopeptidase La [Rhodospirillales bacterium]|nr:endopeptidase La [Rhodospirillales bacterium]